MAGHARVEAARRLHLNAIPTLCLDHLSAAQVREDRLADNQLGALSEWDMGLLTDELRAIIEIGHEREQGALLHLGPAVHQIHARNMM